MKRYRTFQCFWSQTNKTQYVERMTVETDDPRKYAEDLMAEFNATLRPWEKPRTVRSVRHLPFNGEAKHDWEKSNLVTIMKGIHNYDTMRCRNCPVTGKRYGLSEDVTRDLKFNYEKFRYCSLSQKGK